MNRWSMCSRCGVKLQLIEDKKELQIYMCPIEKEWYMTFSGKLLKDLEKISALRGMSIQDLIHEAARRGMNTVIRSE